MSTLAALPPNATASRELVISRVIDAPCDRVFRAWTQHLAEWWGPHGMKTRVLAMDLRPGGAFRTVMRAPDGTEYPTRGVFLEILPNERIVFTDGYEPGWMPAEDHFMTAVITLEPSADGKTRYTARVLHKSVADRERHEQMGFYQGWGECLDQLAAVAASPSL